MYGEYFGHGAQVMPYSSLIHHRLIKVSRGLWASSRFKTHELCTHEERVNVWKMHTCEYSIGSNPHSFWVCMSMYV